MRVIAGERRGRRLRVPRGLAVRPALARVKTSLFDILASRGLIRGRQILDLFAGSGALGIEALSRGAASVVFVEQERRAAATLRANLTESGLLDRSVIRVEPVARALARLGRSGAGFDGVFVDPPWDTGEAERTLRRLFDLELLRDDGWVAVHARHSRPPARGYGEWTTDVDRRVGDAVLVLYRRERVRVTQSD